MTTGAAAPVAAVVAAVVGSASAAQRESERQKTIVRYSASIKKYHRNKKIIFLPFISSSCFTSQPTMKDLAISSLMMSKS